jgi:hypothetical protein
MFVGFLVFITCFYDIVCRFVGARYGAEIYMYVQVWKQQGYVVVVIYRTHFLHRFVAVPSAIVTLRVHSTVSLLYS